MRPIVSFFVYAGFATAIITAYFVIPAYLFYWCLQLFNLDDS